MVFQKILPFIILPSVFPYHFYNPSTHDILTQPSLNDVPPGYKLLPPPKNNRGNSKTRRGRNGRCTDAGFTCTTPYARSLTYQFECDEDYQCPETYKCCQQKCFLHKICSKSTSAGTNSSGNNNCHRPGTCEKWPYNCPKPYRYSLTSVFKCSTDRQCPRGFKCCEQNCFLHNICSRVLATVTPTTRKSYKITITEPPRTKIDLITEATTQENIYTQRIEPEDGIGGGGGGEEEEEDEEEEEYEGEEEEDNYDDNTGAEENTEALNILHIVPNETTTESNVASTSPESSLQISTEFNLLNEKPRDFNFSISKLTTVSPTGTPDSNAIIPEYAAYYYHYGDGNDTSSEYDDYDDEKDYD